MNGADEAVEAAARALYFYLDEDHRGAPAPWESLAEDDEAKIDAKETARIALKAAAPFMLAAAWDAALQDADDEGYLREHQAEFMKKRNPYRSQA
jgi:hypothetical protein